MMRPLYEIPGSLRAPRADGLVGSAGWALWRSDIPLIALFTLVGAALRLVMLGSPALWADEAFQGIVSAEPLPRLLTVVAHDSAPPLSYLLVHLTTAVLPSAAGVRLVSALSGCAVIPLGAALARRVAGGQAAVVAAALLALVPAEVVMSRDARMYALASALVLAAMLALLRCAERPSPARFAVWALCAGAGVYTHYFVAIAIACQVIAAVAILRRDRAFLAGIAAGSVAVALAMLPWALYALPQLSHLSARFWVHSLTWGGFQELPINLMNGSAGAVGGLLGMAIHNMRIACVCALFVGLGALAWTRRFSRQTTVLIAAGLGSLLAVALLSLAKPIFEPRYLQPLWQPVLPVVAVGLVQLPWRSAVALLLLPMAVTSPVIAASLPNADVPALLATMPADLNGSQVITSGSQYYFPVYYYGSPAIRERLRIAGAPVRWFDGAAGIPPGTYIGGQVPTVSGILYLFGNRGYWARVAAGYSLRSVRCTGDICLRVYDPRPAPA